MNQIRNKAKKIIAIAIIISSFFMIGANTMSTQQNYRKAKGAAALERITLWHSQIAFEMPKDMQREWQEVGGAYPCQLLRSCSIEYSESEL